MIGSVKHSVGRQPVSWAVQMRIWGFALCGEHDWTAGCCERPELMERWQDQTMAGLVRDQLEGGPMPLRYALPGVVDMLLAEAIA